MRSCITKGMSLRIWNGWVLKEKGRFSHCNKREGTHCAFGLIATDNYPHPFLQPALASEQYFGALPSLLLH